MRRIGICLSLAFVAGCAYPPPKVDLLYGPQLIPTPSTASVPGGTGQQPPPSSYYDQQNGGGTTGGNTGGAGTTGGTGTGTGAGTGTGTGGSNPYDPNYGSGGSSPGNYSPGDGSFNYGGGQSSTSRNNGFQPVNSSSGAADPFSSSRAPAGAPAQGSSGSNPGTSTPANTGSRYNNGATTSNNSTFDNQAASAPGRFVPPTNASPLNGRQNSSVQPVSYSRQVSESGSSRGSYDFDPDYQWLRGQLDYSESEHRWKLRYIPITGETDDYGGSVILSGGNLDGYRSGEFVTVSGRLNDSELERGGYAPLYQVERVSRVE